MSSMADISPYQIAVPEDRITDLQHRLALAAFPPDELDGAGWDYGAPLADVKRLAAYWRDRFDWRAVEARLNQLPHFMTQIQCDGFESLKIHFLHRRSEVQEAVPLLFVHGCECFLTCSEFHFFEAWRSRFLFWRRAWQSD